MFYLLTHDFVLTTSLINEDMHPFVFLYFPGVPSLRWDRLVTSESVIDTRDKHHCVPL